MLRALAGRLLRPDRGRPSSCCPVTPLPSPPDPVVGPFPFSNQMLMRCLQTWQVTVDKTRQKAEHASSKMHETVHPVVSWACRPGVFPIFEHPPPTTGHSIRINEATMSATPKNALRWWDCRRHREIYIHGYVQTSGYVLHIASARLRTAVAVPCILQPCVVAADLEITSAKLPLERAQPWSWWQCAFER